jgi:hypothetical protein
MADISVFEGSHSASTADNVNCECFSQESCMVDYLTIWIGQGTRIISLILADRRLEGRSTFRVFMVGHGDQRGGDEMLQMLEEGGAGCLAQVSCGPILITE